MIRFFENKDINKQNWDKCLEQSGSAKIYAYSWYLDIVSPNWKALIQDDYTSIFPLPIILIPLTCPPSSPTVQGHENP